MANKQLRRTLTDSEAKVTECHKLVEQREAELVACKNELRQREAKMHQLNQNLVQDEREIDGLKRELAHWRTQEQTVVAQLHALTKFTLLANNSTALCFERTVSTPKELIAARQIRIGIGHQFSTLESVESLIRLGGIT